MSYFAREGNTFSVAPDEALDLHRTLPPGTYTVKQHPITGQFFLEIIKNYSIEGKVYGSTNTSAQRVLNTFRDRPNSTGALFSGLKGSGKTMESKLLSHLARENYGIPTIVVNDAFSGDNFNKFIQAIDQEAIILLDEFEKVYDQKSQQEMLTLLDGLYPSKKLFVLTCNDKYRINDLMTNRPGRIFYHKKFAGLDRQFIQEYCEDVLINKENIPGVLKVSMAFKEFNFDMLKALVEEMNRYNETAPEALVLLNAEPERDGEYFDAVISFKGKKVWSGKWHGNPFLGGAEIFENVEPEGEERVRAPRLSGQQKDDFADFRSLFEPVKVDDVDESDEVVTQDDEYRVYRFRPEHLTNVNTDEGRFTYTRDGFTLTLVRPVVKSYEWHNAF
jgi:hypothetical protein